MIDCPVSTGLQDCSSFPAAALVVGCSEELGFWFAVMMTGVSHRARCVLAVQHSFTQGREFTLS